MQIANVKSRKAERLVLSLSAKQFYGANYFRKCGKNGFRDGLAYTAFIPKAEKRHSSLFIRFFTDLPFSFCLVYASLRFVCENKGCGTVGLNMGGISADLVMRGNLDVEYADIPGWGKGDFKLRDGSLAFRRGFKDVDVSVMGLCGAECRSEDAKICSWFTSDDVSVYFHVANNSDKDAEVKYEFSSDYDCDMSAYNFNAVVPAGGEITKTLPMTNNHFEYVENGQYNLRLVNNVHKITARSSQPGVRAAEIYNKKVIKQLAD